MSLHPSSRLPARADDDELALDRPARPPWRDLYADADTSHREDVRPVVVSRPARSASPLDAVSRGIGLLLKLTLLLILLAVLWGMVTLIGVGVRAPSAIGEQIGGAIERGTSILGAAGQRVADTFDPAHPPRAALPQDV